MRSNSRMPSASIALVVVALAACSDNSKNINEVSVAPATLVCDQGNGGITLPTGFCAVVVADITLDGKPAAARHMAVTPSGDVFVAINNPSSSNPSFGVVGLRDSAGTGHATAQSHFSPGLGGSGIVWNDGNLYFGANDRVLRFTLPNGQMNPTGDGQVIVGGLPAIGDHVSKTVLFRDAQTLIVNTGSATNSCQVDNRKLHSPGQNPCPELPTRAGVWTFSPSGTNQTQAQGHHLATGYRNMVALDINPANGALYGVQQGRDMLADNWPETFSDSQAAVMPAEEFVRIDDGSNNGWPYCFYDGTFQHKKLLAPEYGGDNVKTSTTGIDCASFNQPLDVFGGHWSPLGLHFYRGSQFPQRYRGGVFVVFHGGFDRNPLPNEGYKVMFIPMGADGKPSGPQEVFADGFAGTTTGLPGSAVHRPVGVAEGPDGSLYFSDDKGGRIWRVVYKP